MVKQLRSPFAQCDVIITCMGRLVHLKQTLPLTLKFVDAHFIVVDYSCPDHCGDWIEEHFPQVQVVRVPGCEYFNLSHARNEGARVATAPWLFFIDADTTVVHDFVRRLGQLQNGHSYHIEPGPHPLMGSFLCQRSDFEAVGGYDELIRGWGCEDVELYQRLAERGVKAVTFAPELMHNIPHTNAERTRHYQHKNFETSRIINRFYATAKVDLRKLRDKPLTQPALAQLWDSIAKTVQRSMRTRQPADMHIAHDRLTIGSAEISRVSHYHLDWDNNSWTPGQRPDGGGGPARAPFKRALETINSRWSASQTTTDESPVFLLASGVRTGSTMLQRALLHECFVWGEPWGAAGLIRSIAAPLTRVSASWPPDYFFESHSRFQEDLQKTWTANMAPLPADVSAGIRAYLQATFGDTARRRGYQCWGIKEVRLDGDDALFLRHLFPAARIVFLLRDPFDAYRSYRRTNDKWLLHAPDDYLDSPQRFGRHWNLLTRSFLQYREEVGACLVQYEKLMSDPDERDRLETYLGFALDDEALATRVRGETATYTETLPETIEKELQQLNQVVAAVAGPLGYTLD